MSVDQLRLLPSIDELLQSATGQQLIVQFSRGMTLRAVRASIAQARKWPVATPIWSTI